MIRDTDARLDPLLRREVGWMIRLRWWAGIAIILGDVEQGLHGPLFEHPGSIASVGVGVLILNALLAAFLRWAERAAAGHRTLLALAWVQVFFDLVALTALTLLTGGLASPILALYFFHMLFASLLLPRLHAYGAALLAVGTVAGAFALTGMWPETTDRLVFGIGWGLALIVGVHLANHVTRAVFTREQNRLEQLDQLTEMQEQIADHERAMLQQEKLVAIGQLAAGVAHEVSNPLASMDGLLQMMQRHPDKPRPEAVGQLRDQVQRITQTVRQLNTLSHPDLGKPERADLNQLVTATLAIVEYDHRLRRVEMSRELGDDVGVVNVVPRAVQQALMNLVLNALDAMSEVESPQLTVRTRRDGAWRVLEIADNGHGIAAADRERIMQPFVTSKPAGRGTGLGLPISLGLVREQGGELTFESEPARGTTFRIRLPAPTMDTPDAGADSTTRQTQDQTEHTTTERSLEDVGETR